MQKQRTAAVLMDVEIEWGSTKAWDSFASHLDLIKHALLPPSGHGNMYVKALISLAESIYNKFYGNNGYILWE